MWQELKKKKGIKEEIQLTTKQKEMMQIQLEKESATRKRLQEVRSSKVCPVNQVIKTDCPPVWHFKIPCLQLDGELQSVVGLLEATLIERPAQITRELPAVLQVLMPLLHSPLAAPSIQQVFLDIGVCLMPKSLQHLGTKSVLV